MKRKEKTIFQEHSKMKRRYQKKLPFISRTIVRNKGRRDAKKYQLPIIINETLQSPYLSILQEQTRHLENNIWLQASKDLAPMKIEVARVLTQYLENQKEMEEVESSLKNKTQISTARKLGEENTEESILLARRQKEQNSQRSPQQNRLRHLKQIVQEILFEGNRILRTLIELETLSSEMTHMIRHHYQERAAMYLEGATQCKKQTFYSKKNCFNFDDSQLENQILYFKEYLFLKDSLQQKLGLYDEEEEANQHVQ